MRRGEIYWTDISPRSGSEQRGRRPAVIVSHDAFNLNPGWGSVLAVPISTSSAQARRGPTAVRLPPGAGGLARDSVALCHQVTTVDRSKCERRIGALSNELLEEVDAGLRIALDLER